MSGGGGGGEAPSVASSLPAFYYAAWLLLREGEGAKSDAETKREARRLTNSRLVSSHRRHRR